MGDLADMGRFRIVAAVQSAVPHVALAESPDDLIRRLIDADREVAVAQQQSFFGRQNRPVDLDHMAAGQRWLSGRGRDHR